MGPTHKDCPNKLTATCSSLTQALAWTSFKIMNPCKENMSPVPPLPRGITRLTQAGCSLTISTEAFSLNSKNLSCTEVTTCAEASSVLLPQNRQALPKNGRIAGTLVFPLLRAGAGNGALMPALDRRDVLQAVVQWCGLSSVTRKDLSDSFGSQ